MTTAKRYGVTCLTATGERKSYTDDGVKPYATDSRPEALGMASKIVAHLEARVCIFKPKRKRSEWRDATKEKPTTNDYVLIVATELLAPCAAFYRPNVGWSAFPNAYPHITLTVTSWRPMPRGPKGTK